MKKIMFNDKYCLTSAVLNRTKTMTRRLLKHGTPLSNWEETQKNLPYKVGDIVAIAQCYEVMYAEMIADFTKHNYHIPREDAAEKFKKVYESYAGWKNKMFVKADLMKRHIKITDVKVERLQDISDEDCLCEGVGAFLKRICIAGAEKFEKTADYMYWLECHDADPGISYCRRCATEKAAEMNSCCTGEEYGIGGGCEAEYDAPCSCEECGNPLKFNFCGNTGIDLRCLDLEYTSDLHILNQVLSRGGEDEKETVHMFARKAFTSLIDNISGKGTWESNPWVEAYSFELID